MGLFLGSRLVSPTELIKKGGGSGKYQLLQRISDDNNNEIGTVSGFFTDANNVEYAVVCLDSQYYANSIYACNTAGKTITNLPIYNSNFNLWWYIDAKESATTNTQLILDWCLANETTSPACDHCRNKSFTIDGTTYYGQFPNMKEVFDIWKFRDQLRQIEIDSKGSSAIFNNARNIWSSNQYMNNGYNWYMTTFGGMNGMGVRSYASVLPILEIPNK